MRVSPTVALVPKKGGARSPLRGRPIGRSPPLRGVVEPVLFYVGGSTDVLLGAKLHSNKFFENGAAEGFE
jgi:hypothetical protein